MFFLNRVKSLDPHEAKKMITEGDVVVIDVRSQAVYEHSRIEGAVLVDKATLDHFAEGIEKSKTVICYCYKGISSQAYCKELKKSGFTNVYNLRGGFDAWQKCHS